MLIICSIHAGVNSDIRCLCEFSGQLKNIPDQTVSFAASQSNVQGNPVSRPRKYNKFKITTLLASHNVDTFLFTKKLPTSIC